MEPASFLSPQPNKLRNGHKGLRIFCSEDEQSRTCWLAAFRLFKYGVQLYKNYQQAQSRHLHPSCVGSPPLVSVHRGISQGWAPRPYPRDTWALF